MMRAAVAAAVLMAWATAFADPPTAGAMFAERPLPDGAVSVYGAMGFPGFQLGWRQGFSGTEFGAVGAFSYTDTKMSLDFPIRLELSRGAHHVLGAGVRAGAFYDLGTTWFESTNIKSGGLRMAGELSFTVLASSAADVFFNVDTPIELPLSERGNFLYGVRMGGGGELGVGDGYTVGGQLLAGPELLHVKGGQNTARLDLSLVVGLGRRF